ncbi:MAG: hypothetical protein AAGF20_00715 [Pseudomonadota bacterium]
MGAKEQTAEILQALKDKSQKLIWAEELALSSGARRCDFWTLHPHASQGYRAVAYEIKVSRSDYKRDNYAKQRDARLFSDEFWYVTPKGLITIEELPDWAGLMEWDGQRFSVPLSAPRRDKDAPSWELVVSIMRNSGDIRRDTDLLKEQLKIYKRESERYRNEVLSLHQTIAKVQRGKAAA